MLFGLLIAGTLGLMKKGLQSLSFEMEARDDRGAGDPCRCSIFLRLAVAGRCTAWAASEGQRRGTGRARGRSGRDRDLFGSAVPRPGALPASGLVPAAARPDAVQVAESDAADGLGATTPVGALRRRPLRVADGTLVGVASYAGCAAGSEFAGFAAYGYCAARSRYYWGVRLLLLVDAKGVPIGYPLVPANEKEYEPVRELALGDGSAILVCDKGLWGRQYAETLSRESVRLHTPDRVRTAANLERERSLASRRLLVEPTIANLNCQMRLEHHLAKTPAGLAQRIAQRLLALTIGVLLNTRTGRPPRSLAAYDGR